MVQGVCKGLKCLGGRVAQLGERRPYKPEVAGSSPVPPTNIGWSRLRVVSLKIFCLIFIRVELKTPNL